MKKNRAFIFLFNLMLLSSCSLGQQPIKKTIYSFDLSPDDKEILLAYQNGSDSYIYKFNTETNKCEKILYSKTLLYYNPKYSPDKKTITYITNNAITGVSNIFIADINGRNSRQLTFDQKNITQAIYSVDGKQIFYCKAAEFKNYSPIARKNFHGMDVYAISLNDSPEHKITRFNSYEIGRISNFKKDELLIQIALDLKKIGIYSFNLGRPDKLVDLNPINHPRASTDLYQEPVFNPKDSTIVFCAPNELYIMNEKRMAKRIVRSDSLDFRGIQFYHHEKKLIFVGFYGDNYGIWSINLDGSDLKELNLKLP